MVSTFPSNLEISALWRKPRCHTWCWCLKPTSLYKCRALCSHLLAGTNASIRFFGIKFSHKTTRRLELEALDSSYLLSFQGWQIRGWWQKLKGHPNWYFSNKSFQSIMAIYTFYLWWKGPSLSDFAIMSLLCLFLKWRRLHTSSFHTQPLHTTLLLQLR